MSGLALANSQIPSQQLSLSPSSRGRGETEQEILGQGKDREIAHLLLSQEKQTPNGEN